ncbi:MAG: hypothetical protein ACOYKM_14205 [Caulobacterales bacterium]
MRELTDAELDFVSGGRKEDDGEIIVTAYRSKLAGGALTSADFAPPIDAIDGTTEHQTLEEDPVRCDPFSILEGLDITGTQETARTGAEREANDKRTFDARDVDTSAPKELWYDWMRYGGRNVFTMKDGSKWMDTNGNGVPDMHMRNIDGVWWGDYNEDSNEYEMDLSRWTIIWRTDW